jgi:pimeloyl-ACP methyl ester carboxylesterase
MTLVALSFLAMMILAAPPSASAQAERRGPNWTSTACEELKIDAASADLVTCGYVTTPLRHANPSGAQIRLATVIIHADTADRKPDPLFVGQGGPGGSSIETYANYFIRSPSSRPVANRDIVLWDQRGTLYSKPALLCPEVDQEGLDAALAGKIDDEAEATAALNACGARLGVEVGDLSAFNSVENADDVEDVRAALGYDRINYYGVSYGSELGQFLMRQHPDRLHAVVLDAVVPLTYNLFTEPPFARQRITDRYFTACAADPRCNAAFPDLATRFRALIERLDSAPITVDVAEPDTSTREKAISGDDPEPAIYQIPLTGTLLEAAVQQARYLDVHAIMPLILDRADRGDFTFISSMPLPNLLLDHTFATGMWTTVACAERGDTSPASVDYSGLDPRIADDARKSLRSTLNACQTWEIELLPRADLQPVRSDIPTLLLSGELDPITPPQYAATILPFLSRGQHVIFPYGAHGQAVTNPCANSIIQRFVDEPTASVDSSCVDTKSSAFLTEADVITIPALREGLAAAGIHGMISGARRAVPGLLAALVLLTAIPAYLLGWLIGLIRRDGDARPPAWTLGWSRAAPWLAALAGILLVAFVAGVGVAFSSTLSESENVLALGAVLATWRWVFWLPPLVAALVVCMVIATIALWIGRHRSLIGRVYFTLLTIAGVGAVLNLVSLGLMNLWHG